ncbi:deoxyribodipyrimidine photo-lyase [Catenulispora yoronensis]|uniref:Deoxyribodipyrimidine photo-lyase n=1 Tax=Catenulispora yoronensis TaxID=450799 RepID=A0ABP5FPW1_9ACTN
MSTTASASSPTAAPSAVVLFTRDLRVHDNPVLTAGAAGGRPVVPLFVLDDAITARIPGGRLRFLVESLTDLDEALRKLGGRLVLRSGDVVAEVCQVVGEVGADRVHVATDVTAYAQERERRLAAELDALGVEFHRHDQVHTVQAPGEIRPGDRDYFSVFTPYWRRWAEVPLRAPAAVRKLRVPPVDGLEPADLERLVKAGEPVGTLRGGETAGRKLAQRWLSRTVDEYEGIHDDLSADATSHLSPYLHFGCLSATELVARATRDHPGAGADAFIRQLCWRDFHHQVLAARPDAAHEDLRPRGEWAEDPQALEAWTEGRTGIPIVDAGMRQLIAEGWMHNRARLITASFLSKSLGIDWRAGAAHFARHLLDADVANNALNWQWVAGTGMDTRPNRVLNPLRQAARYDPAGEYVRRYLPELEGLTDVAEAHQPWRLGEQARDRLGYPAPIVSVDGAKVAAVKGKGAAGAGATPLF